MAAVAPLSVLLGVFMIDNLFNDMFNPTMLLSAGGLTSLYLGRNEAELGDAEVNDLAETKGGTGLGRDFRVSVQTRIF